MQDGESIERRDQAKRETIGQAHLLHTQTSTEGTYTVTVTITQRNKSKNDVDLQPTKAIHAATL